jgi:hypothetical protein
MNLDFILKFNKLQYKNNSVVLNSNFKTDNSTVCRIKR